MYTMSEEQLEKKGAAITTREIKQQPALWLEVGAIYEREQEKITAFFEHLAIHKHEPIRVLFTGAGTSAYVGDTILPFIKAQLGPSNIQYESVPTTSLVANPRSYFFQTIPTVLVSFARSGNSPESVAAVQLAQQCVDQLYQITITCAPTGQLAVNAQGDVNNLLLLMPSLANDKGFAMTGSFSCMTLMSLLLFDQRSTAEKQADIATLATIGTDMLAHEADIATLNELTYERVVYLGSGALAGLTREAQLKLLELTAGQVSTLFDSSLGFRHGPKSFVNSETLVFVFVSNDPYTRRYDLDIVAELKRDNIAKQVVVLRADETPAMVLADAYLALPFILFAQTFALLASLKVGNTPDTPSPSGTVNRVVAGVTIHPFEEGDKK